jgi:4-hydroxy-L-threonine phosphate dehydrogenase PdxA
MQPSIGITLGDCAGIGPEIVDLALKSGRLPNSAEYKIVGKYPDCSLGRPMVETARAAAAALEEVVTLARRGEIQAVVTGPVHKAWMYAARFKFPGQTEFFAERCGLKNFAMCLTGGKLTVALVTTHIPLSQVPQALNQSEIVRVGLLLVDFLRRRRTRRRRAAPSIAASAHEKQHGSKGLGDPASSLNRLPFGREADRSISAPRIAVAGLNPHAGESGKLGREEIEIISPAVAELNSAIRDKGPSGSDQCAIFEGPISPDTVFHRAIEGEFDAVLCMYHDQGLIPLKLHAFHGGVNVTLGLPFPRTSPDHGTAFEIAGKDIARPDSMIAAITLAVELAAVT